MRDYRISETFLRKEKRAEACGWILGRRVVRSQAGRLFLYVKRGDKTMRLPFVILNGRDNRRKEGAEAFGMDFGIHLYRI